MTDHLTNAILAAAPGADGGTTPVRFTTLASMVRSRSTVAW